MYLISYLEELPVTARDIAAPTRKDPVLARLYDFTLHGWPQALNAPVLQRYFSGKQELSVDRGCVLWGLRVVIPEKYRVRQLDDFHQEHHGICWRGVVFGGPDWMLLLLRGFSNVMFVLPWASSLQGHHYTLGNGLLSHGSVSTLISLRRAS